MKLMRHCELYTGSKPPQPPRGNFGTVAHRLLNEGGMTAILMLRPKSAHTVHVADALRTPLNRELRQSVRTLLRRGERQIVLDLSAVSRIDAAGVGELIRTFNMTAAVNGALRIVNATAWVRGMLERAHLLDLLSDEAQIKQRLA